MYKIKKSHITIIDLLKKLNNCFMAFQFLMQKRKVFYQKNDLFNNRKMIDLFLPN